MWKVVWTPVKVTFWHDYHRLTISSDTLLRHLKKSHLVELEASESQVQSSTRLGGQQDAQHPNDESDGISGQMDVDLGGAMPDFPTNDAWIPSSVSFSQPWWLESDLSLESFDTSIFESVGSHEPWFQLLPSPDNQDVLQELSSEVAQSRHLADDKIQKTWFTYGAYFRSFLSAHLIVSRVLTHYNYPIK